MGHNVGKQLGYHILSFLTKVTPTYKPHITLQLLSPKSTRHFLFQLLDKYFPIGSPQTMFSFHLIIHLWHFKNQTLNDEKSFWNVSLDTLMCPLQITNWHWTPFIYPSCSLCLLFQSVSSVISLVDIPLKFRHWIRALISTLSICRNFPRVLQWFQHLHVWGSLL